MLLYSVKASPQALALRHVIRMLKKKSYKERFIVKVGKHIKSIGVEEISYFTSQEKTTHIPAKDNRKYILDYSLDQLMEIIDPKQFFRINRKFIISIHSIEDIISYSSNRLKIQLKRSSSTDAIVSREKVQEFKTWLDR